MLGGDCIYYGGKGGEGWSREGKGYHRRVPNLQSDKGRPW